MVRIENQTKNDYFLPVMGTRTKQVLRNRVVTDPEGGQAVLETEEEVEYRAAEDAIHLPPTLNIKDPGFAELEKDVYASLKDEPVFQALVDAREIRVLE